MKFMWQQLGNRGIVILICTLILAADRPYRILKRNSTQEKV